MVGVQWVPYCLVGFRGVCEGCVAGSVGSFYFFFGLRLVGSVPLPLVGVFLSFSWCRLRWHRGECAGLLGFSRAISLLSYFRGGVCQVCSGCGLSPSRRGRRQFLFRVSRGS